MSAAVAAERPWATPARPSLRAVPDSVLDRRWLDGLSHLREFVVERGHAAAPRAHVCADGFRLGTWVANQRTKHLLRGGLPADRLSLLESLPGWAWTGADAEIARFVYEEAPVIATLAAEHATEHGHVYPSASTVFCGIRLADRLDEARSNRAHLLPSTVAAFQALPAWTWNQAEAERIREERLTDRLRAPIREQWLDLFAHLERYTAEHGHARPPKAYVDADGNKVGQWVVYTRRATVRARLEQWQVDRLEALLGWTWRDTDTIKGKHREVWMESLARVRAFTCEHGRLPQRSSDDPTEQALVAWLDRVRSKVVAGTLAEEQQHLLEDLPGWTHPAASPRLRSDKEERDFTAAFTRLEEFVAAHGRIPTTEERSTDGFGLGAWVSRMRAARRRGTLMSVWTARLEAIPGWAWDVTAGGASHTGDPLDPASPFMENLTAYRAFVEAHGRHPVSTKGAEPTEHRLGRWAAKQRERRPSMHPDRIAALAAVPGWAWSRRSR